MGGDGLWGQVGGVGAIFQLIVVIVMQCQIGSGNRVNRCKVLVVVAIVCLQLCEDATCQDCVSACVCVCVAVSVCVSLLTGKFCSSL